MSKFTSHKDEFLQAEKEAIARAMEMIGTKASSYVKEELTRTDAVDTGRLRGSYTYATQSAHSSGEAPAQGDDYATRSTPNENQVCVGSNVVYAASIELGSSHNRNPRPCLRKSIENHLDEYKKIIELQLKS